VVVTGVERGKYHRELNQKNEDQVIDELFFSEMQCYLEAELVKLMGILTCIDRFNASVNTLKRKCLLKHSICDTIFVRM
jgi:hypothetical protein